MSRVAQWVSFLLLLAASLVVTPPANPAAPTGTPAASAQTRVVLQVRGCEGCLIQPVQNNARGGFAYQGREVVVRDGRAVLTVPIRRTAGMAFAVDAPWDEFGLPLVVITAFEGLRPGTAVPRLQTRGTKTVSSCWAGTHRASVTNTIVMTRNRGPLAYGEGRGVVAGAHFLETLPSKPRWVKVRRGSFHVSEADMCS